MQGPDRYPEGTPSWVDLATPDLEAAKQFYQKVFGWWFQDLSASEGGPYTMALKDGKAVAGLAKGPDDFPTAWSTYFAVDDCAACTEKAVAAGGTIMMPVMDASRLGRLSFVIDPSGAPVGLWEAKEHKGAALIDEPGAYAWAELHTPDSEGLSAFYKAAVGLDSSTDADFGGAPYTTFSVGGRAVGGMLTPPRKDVPSYWHTYFGSANCEETCLAVEAAKGSVIAAPFDTPVGKMATVSDPLGAAFSVMQMNEWPTEF